MKPSKKMTHGETLDFIVNHPVSTYFYTKGGMWSTIKEYSSDFWDDVQVTLLDLKDALVSLIYLLACFLAIITWPIAKAVMIWRLRKRILKEERRTNPSTPKGKYRI